MKKTIQLLIILAALSAVSGYLMSQMSWIGKVGINLMHREYKFLKVWWQGGAVVYGVLLLLFVIQSLVHKIVGIWVAKSIHVLLLLSAAAGFYFTMNDFSDDFTHSLLKQRFHIGAYLFWVGWMMISIFFITKKKKIKLSSISSDNKGQATL